MANVLGSEAQAKILVETGVAGFTPRKTIKFASGIDSPGCYVDGRKLPSHLSEWQAFLRPAKRFFHNDEGKVFNTIAGVETGGIAHGAVLATTACTDFVTVRKQEKAHGLSGLIAGDLAAVSGKQVLVVEDMGTTGGSAFAAVKALRDEGALVDDTLFLVIYDFPELAKRAAQLGVNVHTICTFEQVLNAAVSMGKISTPHENLIRSWLQDPWAHWEWY